MTKEILLLIVMFWNLENFFDPFINSIPTDSYKISEIEQDSTLSPDYPFTPRGNRFWTWKKFAQKCDNIAKTIALIKEQYGLFPAIIGVCEAENHFVLQQLTQNTLLAPLNYKIIHKDSPDSRGIDAALLYRKDEFKPLLTRFYPIKVERKEKTEEQSVGIKIKDSVLQTRLLVYVKGVFRGLDTLHCFVAHWPSKLGGEKASLHRRMAASNLLKEVTDSILCSNSRANIVVMGDFNDDTNALPLRSLDNLVNMSLQGDKQQQRQYTYKYKESWSRIDHFLVSENLFEGKSSSAELDGNANTGRSKEFRMKYLFCNPESSDVFKHPFLLEKDLLYLGYKVRRTLVGPRYNGGVSDHLPILLKIFGYDF